MVRSFYNMFYGVVIRISLNTGRMGSGHRETVYECMIVVLFTFYDLMFHKTAGRGHVGFGCGLPSRLWCVHVLRVGWEGCTLHRAQLR